MISAMAAEVSGFRSGVGRLRQKSTSAGGLGERVVRTQLEQLGRVGSATS